MSLLALHCRYENVAPQLRSFTEVNKADDEEEDASAEPTKAAPVAAGLSVFFTDFHSDEANQAATRLEAMNRQKLNKGKVALTPSEQAAVEAAGNAAEDESADFFADVGPEVGHSAAVKL